MSGGAASGISPDGPGSALIGHTGFVGSSLLRQRSFEDLFNSSTVADLPKRSYDLVVCAGAPAQKWIANRDPAGDRARLAPLFEALRALRCGQMILISTVDVFRRPAGVDESTPAEADGLHAYGRHRLEIEQMVRERFPRALIVRLPGLVGPGLRKNAIYDLQHDNNVAAIDSRGVFQFYPTIRLWPDIEAALAAGLDLVHLTAEPVSVAQAAREGFGREFHNPVAAAPAAYDLRTRHAGIAGGMGAYQYSRRESLLAIRAYAQSEPRRAGLAGIALGAG